MKALVTGFEPFGGEAINPAQEALGRLRGLADHFEEADRAMHKTNTVDYAVVFEGEIWLELDEGKTVHLQKGDEIFVRETPEGFEVSPYDPDFKEAMEAAASIAKEYKNALRTLAQK